MNEDSDTNASTLPTSENYLHNNPTPDDHHQYLPIKEEMLENEESSFFKMSSGHPDHHHHHPREFLSGKFGDIYVFYAYSWVYVWPNT